MEHWNRRIRKLTQLLLSSHQHSISLGSLTKQASTMLMCIHRSVLVLICVGLLVLHPQQVCGRLLLRRGVDDETVVIKNHRVLMAADTNTLPTDKRSGSGDDHEHRAFDPNQSSKRKVRRGSDPIHNRT